MRFVPQRILRAFRFGRSGKGRLNFLFAGQAEMNLGDHGGLFDGGGIQAERSLRQIGLINDWAMLHL